MPHAKSLYVQVLRSPILAALLHSTPAAGVSQPLRHGTRNGITELSLRAPPIFGWAAITLGISPHSSYLLKLILLNSRPENSMHCLENVRLVSFLSKISMTVKTVNIHRNILWIFSSLSCSSLYPAKLHFLYYQGPDHFFKKASLAYSYLGNHPQYTIHY